MNSPEFIISYVSLLRQKSGKTSGFPDPAAARSHGTYPSDTCKHARINFDDFSGGKLGDSTAEGKHYGIPFDNGASIMAIRSDMVEAAGLTVEDFKDTTWSEFMELAKKLSMQTVFPCLQVPEVLKLLSRCCSLQAHLLSLMVKFIWQTTQL